MVVRLMPFRPIAQCDKSLDFQPLSVWPAAMPPICWQGLLLTGFEREEGQALDLWENRHCTWLDAITACYPQLGLSEVSRLYFALESARPELAREFGGGLFLTYQMRLSDRLLETLRRLNQTQVDFQNMVDAKKWGPRDLAPLMALVSVKNVEVFLRALPELEMSKSFAVQAFELVIELFLLGRPLSDLLPTSNDGMAYLKRLQQWRRPRTSQTDEQWSRTVSEWPWPAQVQGSWQRFGDQAGIEIKIRTHSPQDLGKKLQKLTLISDSWSCKS